MPDAVLQTSSTLTVTGCAVDFEGAFTTLGGNRFAVVKQAMPEEYMCEDPSTANDILTKLAILGAQIQNVEEQAKIKKFESKTQAEEWAVENNAAGSVIVIHDDDKWIVHAVNDDLSVSPVCNNEDEIITVNFDGGSAFGVLPQ